MNKYSLAAIALSLFIIVATVAGWAPGNVIWAVSVFNVALALRGWRQVVEARDRFIPVAPREQPYYEIGKWATDGPMQVGPMTLLQIQAPQLLRAMTPQEYEIYARFPDSIRGSRLR